MERCGSTNGYFQGGDRITTGINSDVELTILSQSYRKSIVFNLNFNKENVLHTFFSEF